MEVFGSRRRLRAHCGYRKFSGSTPRQAWVWLLEPVNYPAEAGSQENVRPAAHEPEAVARGRLARFGPTETERVRGSTIGPQSSPTSKAARMAARRFLVCVSWYYADTPAGLRPFHNQ